MKIIPIEDRVLIQNEKVEEKTVGGIIIPDTVSKEKPQIGKIIAIGTDDDVKKLFKIGQNVIYAKYGGNEIELDGEKYIILSKSDVLAIVK